MATVSEKFGLRPEHFENVVGEEDFTPISTSERFGLRPEDFANIADIEKQSQAAVNSPVNLFKEALAGAIKIPENIANTPYNLVKSLSPSLSKYVAHVEPVDTRRLFGLPKEQSFAGEIAGGTPDLLAMMALPEANLSKLAPYLGRGAAAGKALYSALRHAAPQALYGASQSSNPLAGGLLSGAIAGPTGAMSKAIQSGSPAARVGAATLFGLGGGYAGGKIGEEVGGPKGEITGSFIGAGLGALSPYAARKGAANAIEGIEGTPYKENLEAARRLGLSYLTPAEASQNPFTGAKQGIIGKTAAGAKQLFEKGTERLKSEEAAIEGLFNKIYNKGEHEALKNSLYESAKKTALPATEIKSFRNDEIIKDAERNVLKKPAYKESLKGVSKNSVQYWDHVKQALDDMIESAPKKEQRIIKGTKANLVKVMDSAAPEYKEARALAEREIARSGLEKAFNKKQYTGNAMAKVLENKKDYSKLMNNLRNAPEAQQSLADMKKIFGNLISPPSVRTAAQLERTSMVKNRNTADEIAAKLMNLFTGGKQDRAAVEFITSPSWEKEIERLTRPSRLEKGTGRLVGVSGKVGAKAARD